MKKKSTRKCRGGVGTLTVEPSARRRDFERILEHEYFTYVSTERCQGMPLLRRSSERSEDPSIKYGTGWVSQAGDLIVVFARKRALNTSSYAMIIRHNALHIKTDTFYRGRPAVEFL